MAVENFTVTVKPLTPLRTGDISGNYSCVRETGIIGSLRWWYEAILRGFGLSVCDPTSDKRCNYDKNKKDNICPACNLFGCTGRSRRFRLVVQNATDINNDTITTIKIRNHPKNNGHKGWRIPSSLKNEFTLKFVPLFKEGFDKDSLYYTLKLIEKFGALGGKTSSGQGIIKIDWENFGYTPIGIDKWINGLKSKRNGLDNKSNNKSQPYVPDLSDFICVTILLNDKSSADQIWKKLGLTGWKIENKGKEKKSGRVAWIPSSPAVRYKLRCLDSIRSVEMDRHRILGTTAKWNDPHPKDKRNDRPKGSDIFVSHLYRDEDNNGQWAMRIFGFIDKNRNDVDKNFRSFLAEDNTIKQLLPDALKSTAEITIYDNILARLDGEKNGLS